MKSELPETISLFNRDNLRCECNSDAIISPADIGLVVSPVKVNL